MTIIYDINMLQGIDDNTTNRSGIYFTAYNILLAFQEKKDIELILYANIKNFLYLKSKFNDFKFLDIYKKEALFISHLSKMYFHKPIFKKITTFIATWCERMHFRIKKNNIPKNAIFFSPFLAPPKFANNLVCFTLLHDVIPFLENEWRNLEITEKLKYKLLNKKPYFYEIIDSLSKDKYYITNSNYTKMEFLKYFENRLDAKKITTSHLGINEKNFYYDFNIIKNKQIALKYGFENNKKYIFSLCSLVKRKNLMFVIDNFIKFVESNKIDDLVLILAGGSRQLDSKFIEKTQNQYISRIGYVDDADLANIFSHSLFSVYLSHYEGFGMPILESMACKSPVICSNTTSMPEVLGDGGILISPTNDIGFIKALKDLYYNESLRKDLSKKAYIQSKKFSWKFCSDRILEAMQIALNNTRKK